MKTTGKNHNRVRHDSLGLVPSQRTAILWEVTRMTELKISNTERLDLASRLAFDRTRVAFERTMLAWTRTGTSLITFGFGVYKFFQIERKPGAQDYIIGSEQFGLVLVCIGLGALALGTLEYHRNMRELGPIYMARPSWLVMLFAGSIAVLGVLAFVVMLIRQ
jgi:putative membrane protein